MAPLAERHRGGICREPPFGTVHIHSEDDSASARELQRVAVWLPQTYPPLLNDGRANWVEGQPRINPCLQRDAGGRVQTGAAGNVHVLATSIEVERLPHHARRKGRTALQRTVIGASDVIGIAVSRPPTDQTRRRWNTIWRLRQDLA